MDAPLLPRTAGGKVLGISATAPVTIAGEAVRCPRNPAATARRDSLSFLQAACPVHFHHPDCRAFLREKVGRVFAWLNILK
jgi:hypothetical protein